MNIVVVGGGGFLGTNISLKFLSEGHRVTVYSRSVGFKAIEHDKINYLYGNTFEENRLKDAIENCDILFFCYALTSPGMVSDDFDEIVLQELKGHFKLLKKVPGHSGKMVAFISSGGTIYGNTEKGCVDEKHLKKPISFYGANKLALEHYIQVYCGLNGLKYLTFRPSNPFGPWQNFRNQQGLISILLSNYLQGKTSTIWGDGSMIRDYIYVDDLINGIYRTVSADFVNMTVNIGTGRGLSVNEIIALVEKVVNDDLNIVYDEARKTDVDRIVLNVDRIKELLDWEPVFTITEGIQKHFEWMQKQLIHESDIGS